MTAIDLIHPGSGERAVPTAQATSVAVQASVFPVVTMILLAAMSFIFAAEIKFGVDPADGLLQPSVRTLMAFGGLQFPLVVGEGQWYRLFSAPLLHLDAMHILLNGIALFLAGRILEPMIGRLWFAALFVIGGIGGGLLSLTVNPHNIVSVGASGAIMTLFAAIYVFSFRLAAGDERSRLQSGALGILITSLLPLSGGLNGMTVDYGAHFGGAIAGVIAGAALLAIWRSDNTVPPLRPVAAAILVAAVFATSYSAVGNARQYRAFELARFLVPQAQLPTGMDAILERSPALVKDYPRDPRARMFHAIALVHADNLKAAENEVRLALSETDILRTMLTPAYKVHLESYLALILFDERRSAEAKDIARAGCQDPSASLHDDLVKAGLCKAA